MIRDQGFLDGVLSRTRSFVRDVAIPNEDRVEVNLSPLSAGPAIRLLDDAIAHAAERVQFGRLNIGKRLVPCLGEG